MENELHYEVARFFSSSGVVIFCMRLSAVLKWSQYLLPVSRFGTADFFSLWLFHPESLRD